MITPEARAVAAAHNEYDWGLTHTHNIACTGLEATHLLGMLVPTCMALPVLPAAGSQSTNQGRAELPA